ncbi:unnamed protein product [Nippostrongylus brasiliensis]|uniref:Apple domain-containing protein n=1 Tax=Nippostrongylus brasiliensis TaxID=27835 RepID=A0A0N4Y042_NIPBR|nr:unnamed protein product [Nippostrongylus brasiliensis]
MDVFKRFSAIEGPPQRIVAFAILPTMRRFSGFVLLLFAFTRTVHADPPFASFSAPLQRNQPRANERVHRPMLLLSNDGPIIDIAVPEEQRLFGRAAHGVVERRSSIPESTRILRNYLRAQEPPGHRGIGQSEDSAMEISVTDHTAGNISSPSLNYRPPPPPVRREVDLEPRCHYDTDRWALHMESSLSHAVMFERRTGGSCGDCLRGCAMKQGGPWTCRSIVYDYNWQICDMFAVAGTSPPFVLVEYEGRDYFEYLAANPPSDVDFAQANDFTLQEQNKTETQLQSCNSAAVEKAPVAWSQRDGPTTAESKPDEKTSYGATPVQDQLQAEEAENKIKEKDKKRKMRKLLKIAKEQFTNSPLFKELQGSVTDIPEAGTIMPELETTMSKHHDDNVSAASSSTEESTRIPDILVHKKIDEPLHPSEKVYRRKEAKKTKTKKSSKDSRKSRGSGEFLRSPKRKHSKADKSKKSKEIDEVEPTSTSESPNVKLSDKEISEKLKRKQRRMEKLTRIFRRKQTKSRGITTSTMTTTTTTDSIETSPITEEPEVMSAKVARVKIELYQQRKAAERAARASPPGRQRIRLREDGRMIGQDNEEAGEDSRERIPSQRVEEVKEEEQEKEEEVPITTTTTTRKPRRKHTAKSRRPKTTTTTATTESITAETTTASTTTTTTIVPPREISRDDLRKALTKEIKKFISKEFRGKF